MINERYVLVTERIRGISSENLIGEPFCSFFARTASLLILLDDVYKLKSGGGLYKLSPDELKDLNGKLYEDIV